MFCSNCNSENHLVGKCPKPLRVSKSPFEKKNLEQSREVQELAAEVAELTEENRQLKLQKCPECERRKKQTRERVKKSRARKSA